MIELNPNVHKFFGQSRHVDVAGLLDLGGDVDVLARIGGEEARRKRIRDFLELDELDKQYGAESTTATTGTTTTPGYVYLPEYGRKYQHRNEYARQITLASKFDVADDQEVNEGEARQYRLTPAQISFRRVLARLDELNHHDATPGMMVWTPVAGGIARESCGEVNAFREARCSTGADHGKTAFVNHDYDYKCPVCYRYGCVREARKMTEKIKAVGMSYARKGDHMGRVYHVVFSPPESEYWRFNTKADLDGLFDQLGEFFEMLGIVGAETIIHRYRKTHDTADSWHFHVLCWLPRGQQLTTDEFTTATGGWVYKNLGKRKTIFGTAFYQLTHAVVPEYMKDDGQLGRAQMVRYFGVLANGNSKKTVTTTRQVQLCEVCAADKHIFIDLMEKGTCDHDIGPYWVNKKKARYSLRPYRTESGRIIDYYGRFLNRWGVMMSMPYKRIDVQPDDDE